MVSHWESSLPPARRTSYSSSALGSQRGAAAYVGASVRQVILKGVGAMRHMWYALHAYLLLLVAPRLPPLVGATYGPGQSQWYLVCAFWVLCWGAPVLLVRSPLEIPALFTSLSSLRLEICSWSDAAGVLWVCGWSVAA